MTADEQAVEQGVGSRTGLVVVSHSHALADAARALAAEMGAGARIEIAAGLDANTFGTDATAVASAIESALGALPPGDDAAGCVVLVDLGSAVLSAELALELLDPALASRVTLCAAPLVEGLVVAAVAAAGGAAPARVAAEAERALAAKRQALGVPEPLDTATGDVGTDTTAEGQAPPVTAEVTVLDPAGLHARPAALLAARAEAASVSVSATNLDTGAGPVAADSMLELMTLGLTGHSRLGLAASGSQAEETLRGLVALIEDEVNGPFR